MGYRVGCESDPGRECSGLAPSLATPGRANLSCVGRRSSNPSAIHSRSVRGTGICSERRRTAAASSGRPASANVALTACQPRTTSDRVAENLAFAGSSRRLPDNRSLATASARCRICFDSPRIQARWMASGFRSVVIPRKTRGVALAAIPTARRCSAKPSRHSRSVAFRMCSRGPCSLTALRTT